MATSQKEITKTRPGRNPFDGLKQQVEEVISSKRVKHSDAVALMFKLEKAAYKTRIPARKAEYTRLRNRVASQVFGVTP